MGSRANPHLMAADNRDLTVRSNGVTLQERHANGVWLVFSIRPVLIRPGVNRFEFELEGRATTGWTVRDLVVCVRFPDGK